MSEYKCLECGETIDINECEDFLYEMCPNCGEITTFELWVERLGGRHYSDSISMLRV